MYATIGGASSHCFFQAVLPGGTSKTLFLKYGSNKLL